MRRNTSSVTSPVAEGGVGSNANCSIGIDRTMRGLLRELCDQRGTGPPRIETGGMAFALKKTARPYQERISNASQPLFQVGLSAIRRAYPNPRSI